MENRFRPGAPSGRTAFIAGRSSGIKLGIAERFSALGTNRALLPRKPEIRHAEFALLRKMAGGRWVGPPMLAQIRGPEGIQSGIGYIRTMQNARRRQSLPATFGLSQAGQTLKLFAANVW